MKSKIFHAFTQKLHYFDDDIELIDAIRICVINGDLSDPSGSNVLRSVDPAKHPHLVRRQNSDGSRKNVINHLRATVYSSYVKDVYEEVTHYLRSILKQASLNKFDSGRIIGEHAFKLDAKKILEMGSWENICEHVSDSVFQSLESERSTLKLVSKTAIKLGLSISQKSLDEAIPFLEVRHFLVHSDGRLSNEFMAKNPSIKSTKSVVDLDYSFISNLRTKVMTLISEFDAQVISVNLLKPEDLQP